jgi:hypothetical protein
MIKSMKKPKTVQNKKLFRTAFTKKLSKLLIFTGTISSIWFIHEPVRIMANESSPLTETEAIAQGYELTNLSEAAFHQNILKSGEPNRKYISPDGRNEVIFYSDGNLNQVGADIGTYNFVPYNTGIIGAIGHGIVDVVPYLIWGNSVYDQTSFSERISMIFC